MSPSERRRYDERRALLIENDLNTWYMKSMSVKAIERRRRSASALAKKLQLDNRREEVVHCDHTVSGTKTAATVAGRNDIEDTQRPKPEKNICKDVKSCQEEHVFKHIGDVVEAGKDEALPTIT